MAEMYMAQTDSKFGRSPRTRGDAKIFLLAVTSFVLGAGVTGYWLHRAKTQDLAHCTPRDSARAVVLSENTKAVLGQIKSPVEVRFYSLLDPETVSESTKGFAQRAGALISEYERIAGGKISVRRFDSQSYTNANAAAKDGIKAFNADKGETCFLGVALVLKGQRETLPQLSPEWEPVLESDLTRAIARLLESSRPAPPPVAVSAFETNAVQEVRAMIPDIGAVSLQDGNRLLRESALKEFQAVLKDGETRIKEAQQALVDAQASKSAEEQDAARKRLLQVQAEQMDKLKDLAAKSQAQVDAFERLKAAQ